MNTDALTQLRSFPILSLVGNHDLEKIATTAYEEQIPAGTIFIEDNHPGEKAYLILSGIVQIYKLNDQGKEITITFRTQGDIVGEMALFDELPRSAFAKALQETHVLVLPKKPFVALLHSSPSLSLAIIQVLTKRIRENVQTLEQTTTNLTHRVYLTLATLADHFPKRVLPLSQEELAHIVGATRPRVTEVLSELQQKGKIQISPRKIQVL